MLLRFLGKLTKLLLGCESAACQLLHKSVFHVKVNVKQ